MKQQLLFMALILLAASMQAQDDSTSAPQKYGRHNRTSMRIPDYVPRLSYDLSITKLEVALTNHYRLGSNRRKRIIKYTITNTGEKYIKLVDIIMQGYVSNIYSLRPDSMTAACGQPASKTKNVLLPGGSYDGYFICDYDTYWDDKLYYLLKVDDHNIITETDETNNCKINQLNFINN